MQLPNESSDRSDTERNSAEFSAAHLLALNLEAVFNLAMSNALGREEGSAVDRTRGGVVEGEAR